MTSTLKKLPVLLTDEDAERFVDEADLSEYDLSGFKPMKFELRRKDAHVNMRLPQPLLEKIKQRATETGIPYQRLMREWMERGLETSGEEPFKSKLLSHTGRNVVAPRPRGNLKRRATN